MARIAAALAALAASAAVAQSANPLARGTWGSVDSAPIQGAWTGADSERRSLCTHPENDGNRGTYAQFDVSTDLAAHTLGIDQSGITGLDCTYLGAYSGAGPSFGWSGTYSCTDGKHGAFTSRSISVTPNALTVHLDVKLDGSETCTIEKVIAAGRLYP
jgi:opacity protein-like surface antigen